MINLKELWIGDIVKIVSSGRIGKFEGIHASGKARINASGKIYLAGAKNLVIYEAPEAEEKLFFDEPSTPKKKIADTIDLHIEKLKPDMLSSLPERIYDYQMKACIQYINDTKDSHMNSFTIIHGKGSGVLKQSVMDYIKTVKTIKFYEVIHDGGAVRIHL